MSEWITGRNPDDKVVPNGYDPNHVYASDGYVWSIYDWDNIPLKAWQYIPLLEPYVDPHKWQAVYDSGLWYLWNGKNSVPLKELTDEKRHQKAAERIAAIYNEVMP